jgi:hypothetical protein
VLQVAYFARIGFGLEAGCTGTREPDYSLIRRLGPRWQIQICVDTTPSNSIEGNALDSTLIVIEGLFNFCV